MDLLLSENRMVLGNTSIPVQQVGLPKKDRYAWVADHYIIPGMSQMVIEVFVDRADRPQSSVDHVLVETKPSLIDRHSVLLAPTVLNVGDRVTGSIVVLNPFTQPVSLKQDEVIACVEEIDGVNTVLLHQESLDSESLSERELAGTQTQAGAVKNGCQQKAPCPANEFKSPSLDTSEHIYLQSNPLEGIKSYQSGVSPTGVQTLADETDVSPSVNWRERENCSCPESRSGTSHWVTNRCRARNLTDGERQRTLQTWSNHIKLSLAAAHLMLTPTTLGESRSIWEITMIGLDWICLTTTHVLQDILAVLHKWMCLKIAFIL